MLSKTLSIIGLGVAMLLISPENAWAYIDPGTGSYLFQLVVAGGLAAAYTLRMYWANFRNWISGRRADNQTEQPRK